MVDTFFDWLSLLPLFKLINDNKTIASILLVCILALLSIPWARIIKRREERQGIKIEIGLPKAILIITGILLAMLLIVGIFVFGS